MKKKKKNLVRWTFKDWRTAKLGIFTKKNWIAPHCRKKVRITIEEL